MKNYNETQHFKMAIWIYRFFGCSMDEAYNRASKYFLPGK